MQRARSDTEKDQRRKALLKAALDEFYERGFAAARMDDIAQRAGLSKGTVYLYFASKETLFAALIESLTQPNIRQLEMIASTMPSAADAIRAIAQFAPGMIRHSDVPRLMKVLIGESNTFPEVVKTYRQTVIDRVLAAVTAMLAKASAAGEIRIGDPHLTARLVVAPIAFSGIWKVVFGADPQADVDLEGLFEMHAELFIRAIATKEVTS